MKMSSRIKLCALGASQYASGRTAEAEVNLRAAVEEGGYPEAEYNLGVLLQRTGRGEEAALRYSAAVSMRPDYAKALNNLGVVLMEMGRAADASVCLSKATASEPTYWEAWGNLILAMSYDPGADSEAVATVAAAYSRVLTKHTGFPKRPPLPARDGTKRLRVGYVSADFRAHSVTVFASPAILGHDRSRFEVFVYDVGFGVDDHVTDEIKYGVENWRCCRGWSDRKLSREIRGDRIDVLVDLSGHTAGHRMGAFAFRPAPVQATWLGYPGPTGLEFIDFRVSDPKLEEGGSFGEPAALLSAHAATDFESLNAPEPGPLPSLSGESFTFACLNNHAKINAKVVVAWAKILNLVPGSKLMLYEKDGGGLTNALWEDLSGAGITLEKLTLVPKGGLREHLELHQRVDLALDPFPYGGMTTTLHSAWMGVPVLCLHGNRATGRCSSSIMSAVGMDYFVAENVNGYVNRAVFCATRADGPSLSEVRGSLRQRVRDSAYADVPGLVRGLERAYMDAAGWVDH